MFTKVKHIFIIFIFVKTITSSNQNSDLSDEDLIPDTLSFIEQTSNFFPEMNPDLSDEDSICYENPDPSDENLIPDTLSFIKQTSNSFPEMNPDFSGWNFPDPLSFMEQISNSNFFLEIFSRLTFHRNEFAKVPYFYNDPINERNKKIIKSHMSKNKMTKFITKPVIQQEHEYRKHYFEIKREILIEEIMYELAKISGFIPLDAIEIDVLVNTEKNFVLNLKQLNSDDQMPYTNEIFDKIIRPLIANINQFGMLIPDENQSQESKKKRILKVLLDKSLYLKCIFSSSDLEKIERYIEDYIDQNDTIGKFLERSEISEKTKKERIMAIIKHRDFFLSNPLIPANISYLIREYKYVSNEIENSEKILNNDQNHHTRIISKFEVGIYNNLCDSKNEFEEYIKRYLSRYYPAFIRNIHVQYCPVFNALSLFRGVGMIPLTWIESCSRIINAPHKPAIYRNNSVKK